MWGAILSWLKGAMSGIGSAAKDVGSMVADGSGASSVGTGISNMLNNGMNKADMGTTMQGVSQLNALNQQQLSKNQLAPLPNYPQPQPQNPYSSVYMQYRR